MAKKQKTEKVEAPVVEAPAVTTTKPKKPTWEVKDRTYVLKEMSPLSYHLRSSGLYYFDEEKGYEREVCYSRNQRTCFVDEMKGDIRRGHVWFRNGMLYVPKNEVMLQKFLSLYHPSLSLIHI